MPTYAVVDFADAGEVRLLKPDIKNRSERNRTPWEDSNYQVQSVQGGWSYFRRRTESE
jgi:hypothetical protein